MASGVLHNGRQDPIPLFSPTQVTSSERVLHSIFSPNLQGGLTTFGKVDKQKREEEKRMKVALAAKRLKPCTPSSVKQQEKAPDTAKNASKSHTSFPGAPKIQSPDQFFSPVGRSGVPFCAGAKTLAATIPSNLARNVFFSPRHAQSPDFASPLSTISALTNASTSSFKTLPIDMLSYDFVSNCESLEALQQIVNTLSADSPRHFPSLLRKAKKQLESISETKEKRGDVPASNLANAEDFQQESALDVSSTKEDSSLALSLSSSLLDGGIDAEVAAMGKSTVNDKADVKQSTDSPAPVHDERKVAYSNRRTIAANESAGSRTMTETKLLTQIQHMAAKVRTLETSKQRDSANLLLKLRSLEEAKNQAERKVAMLEKAVASSTSQARDAVSTLANIREESRLLKGRLQHEKESARSRMTEAQKVQDGLQRKIESLSQQLAQCKARTADATKSLEKRFREKSEKESARRDSDMRLLKQALQDARMNLDAIKEERTETLRSIQHALGKSTDGIDRLSAQERKEAVCSIARKLSSSRVATKALSKALTEAETDRKRASEAKESANRRLHESSTLCRRLERENALLTKKVQELNGELESSRTYIDTLLAQKSSESEWDSKEREYKNVISNLRAQIRGGEAMVSLALYRKAVGEARARALDCQSKKLEINELSRRLKLLERRLIHEKPQVQARKTPPDEQAAVANARQVTPTSAISDENADPQTPNYRSSSKVGETDKKSRPPPPLVAYRVSAVREAGGRAGLCAKLKQMRGSPLANNSSLA